MLRSQHTAPSITSANVQDTAQQQAGSSPAVLITSLTTNSSEHFFPQTACIVPDLT